MAKKNKLTLRKFDSALAALEGGKTQAKIGDIRQIRANICAMMAASPEIIALLLNQGIKILKRQKK